MSQQSMLSSQETPTRKAAPRCTEDEKIVLLALVGEFKHIIEYKKTDAASIAKKMKHGKRLPSSSIPTTESPGATTCSSRNAGITSNKYGKRKLQERSESATKLTICGGANPVELSQLPTGTDADEDSRCTYIAQPDAEANISAEGCANSHQATVAAGSSTPAATVAAQTYRAPRRWMAVLEKHWPQKMRFVQNSR
ncbi:hypothetical protein HPB51_000368 [Rhipicephalus microplus]|uniref:Uncharacterized protein n=1 Tax=Rhipicephalus microplus TaxID=6941 RepID=A0A9J6DY61_RHIMP|nr:hypothetical protein HPB51_000368 [Rhipicephalus microplus]